MDSERKNFIILTILFSFTAVLGHAAARYHTYYAHLPDWSAVLGEFNGWRTMDATLEPVYGDDPSESSLLRIYSRRGGKPVIVYIAFYGDLAKILELHTPDRCYSGQGWRILSSRSFSAGTFRGKPIPAKEMVVEKDGAQRLVQWWYMAGPRPFRNRIRYVYAMLALSALTGRTDGDLVRFETLIEAGQEATASKRLEDFRESFQDQLDRALPR